MDEPTPVDRDDTLRSAQAAALLGAGISVVALGTHGPKAALSVAAGAAIAVGNLLAMRAIVRALLPPDEGGSGRVLWAVLAVVKMLLLFGGIWLLLTTGKVAPIGLVVGYGVLPLGMVAAALWPKPRPKD